MHIIFTYITFGLVAFLFIIIFFLIFGWRWLTKKIVKNISNILFTDSYQENLIELLPGFRHMGVQNVLENNLRSESGDVLHRPLGSSKTWPHLDPITFIPSQTKIFAISSDEDIDLSVTIGPKIGRATC